jgi:pyruvate,water dikinase
MCQARERETSIFESINLGNDITLEAIERLEDEQVAATGMRGKMVSSRTAFKGKVRHYDTIAERPLLGGEVILAQYLEPELVGLFDHSVGCLTDMGGALSHAAIVARELDYPIVVLAGSSEIICDGDEVEVSLDGSINITRKGS